MYRIYIFLVELDAVEIVMFEKRQQKIKESKR